MRVLYLDCFAGIAGDMLLGALIDAGVRLEDVRAGLGRLPIRGWELRAERVSRKGISGTRIEVAAAPGGSIPHRLSYQELVAAIEGGGLSDWATERSLAVLRAIAEAEARVHGVSVEEVHFHEVGGIDTLVDVAGAAVALELLGIERVASGPLPMSHGFVECAHGKLPVPAPAVTELLKGVATVPLDIEGETVTPTGAAIAVSFAESFGPPPPMMVQAVGHGAGTSEWADVPNVLRVLVGETQAESASEAREVVVLEANLDDMPPEHFALAMERCLEAGALDVWFTPIQMKKNRPAIMLSVLAEPEDAARLADVIFENTTTFGLRQGRMSRVCLPRRHETVETPHGPIRVKIAALPSGRETVSPEYEDCLEAARREGVPVRVVHAAALGGKPE
ncbi:MAG: nickel pincer cofactor biosynthesis protein LarC [Armatimonadetes bacterium]|nr:nickel pincer cofactor biosynthesis protein LarC [Armatimonadota bacterium]